MKIVLLQSTWRDFFVKTRLISSIGVEMKLYIFKKFVSLYWHYVLFEYISVTAKDEEFWEEKRKCPTPLLALCAILSREWTRRGFPRWKDVPVMMIIVRRGRG